MYYVYNIQSRSTLEHLRVDPLGLRLPFLSLSIAPYPPPPDFLHVTVCSACDLILRFVMCASVGVASLHSGLLFVFEM